MISLSGIIVILARGTVRGRRLQFAASIKSHEGRSPAQETNEVLRPTQKSVQAIRSRAALVSQWMGQARAGIAGGGAGLKSRLGSAVPRRRHLAALRHKAASGSRAGWQGLRGSFRRNKESERSEPNLDTLFAEDEARGITLRVIDTAPAKEPVPAAPLPALRQNHTAPAKKKLSPLQRAQAALQSKDFQHAENILVDYIVHHTKDTKAYMLLGRVAMAKANWDECMEIFEQVMLLRPEEPGAQAGLGIAAYHLGRYSKALPALQRAHEEDPQNLTVLTDLFAIAKKMDNPALQRSIQSKLQELESAPSATDPVGLRS